MNWRCQNCGWINPIHKENCGRCQNLDVTNVDLTPQRSTLRRTIFFLLVLIGALIMGIKELSAQWGWV